MALFLFWRRTNSISQQKLEAQFGARHDLSSPRPSLTSIVFHTSQENIAVLKNNPTPLQRGSACRGCAETVSSSAAQSDHSPLRHESAAVFFDSQKRQSAALYARMYNHRSALRLLAYALRAGNFCARGLHNVGTEAYDLRIFLADSHSCSGTFHFGGRFWGNGSDAKPTSDAFLASVLSACWPCYRYRRRHQCAASVIRKFGMTMRMLW